MSQIKRKVDMKAAESKEIESVENFLDETSSEDLLTQDELHFAPAARSIIFKEPSFFFVSAFLLLAITSVILTVWAAYCDLTISETVAARIYSREGDLLQRSNRKFIFEKFLVVPGQGIQKGDPFLAYVNAGNDSVLSKLSVEHSGIITQIAPLKRGSVYLAHTELAHIRAMDAQLGIELTIPTQMAPKVRVGQEVLFDMSEIWTDVPIARGTIVGEPILDRDRFLVQAHMDSRANAELGRRPASLFPGVELRAEIVFGRQSVLRRLFGL